MKILRIIPFLDFGGVEQVLKNTVLSNEYQILSRPKILVLSGEGYISKNLIKHDIEIFHLNTKPKIPNFLLIRKIYDFLRKDKFDIIHCQGAEANFHGLIAAKLAGVPIRIGEEIGFPNHHSYWKIVFKGVYFCSTKVIAISEAVKKKIVELGEVPASKVKVIYNPVSLPLNISPDLMPQQLKSLIQIWHGDREKQPFIFITTCRLVPIKNLERLILAFRDLLDLYRDKNIQLWIIGEGPDKEKLIDLTSKNNIADHVVFWGFQEHVFFFLNQADVFILPSLTEGSSVSLAEAMVMGLPSIVTKVGGAGEVIGNSQSGILIDPLDVKGITDAMKTMLDLTLEEYRVKSIAAKKEAERFSVQNYVDQLLTIYSR